MDQYFKLERAREEIQRLNIEIPRVVTYMQDEREFLAGKEAETRLLNPALARQIHLYAQERGRADARHMERFKKLARTPGFSGSILPGISVDRPTADIAGQQQAQTDTGDQQLGDKGGSLLEGRLSRWKEGDSIRGQEAPEGNNICRQEEDDSMDKEADIVMGDGSSVEAGGVQGMGLGSAPGYEGDSDNDDDENDNDDEDLAYKMLQALYVSHD